MQFLYNVDFHYQEDNLKDCAISIGIGSGSLENAIELLEFAVGIKFEKNGALYHIKGTCKQL